MPRKSSPHPLVIVGIIGVATCAVALASALAQLPSGPYAVSGPSSGDVHRAATFSIALGEGVSGIVRVTPRADNGDGTFTPAFLDLSQGAPSGNFTYTPTLIGPREIAVGNDRGLAEPATIVFTGKMQLGKTVMLPNPENNGGVPPTEQSHTPDLGGYVPFQTGPLSAFMQPIDDAPVDPRSDRLMSLYQPGAALESRKLYTEGLFGQNYMESTMPFNVVAGNQPMVTVTYDNPNEAYPNESDPGPMPIPPDAAAQAGLGTPTTPPQNDGHLIVLDRDNEILYELYKAYKDPVTDAWHAGAGAIFDLKTGGGGYRGTGSAHTDPGELRPLGWTSADAAGMPIFPFLVRYDEVARGEIRHALRATFSVGRVAGRYVYPARHYAGGARSWDETTLPYGARLRLKQDWYEQNKNTFGPQSRVIVDAMRTYGIFNSDIGFDFSLAGVADSRWDYNNDIIALRSIPAHAFEVVKMEDDFTITASPSVVHVGEPVTISVTYHFRPGENVNAIETYITDNLLQGACIACGTRYLRPSTPTGTFTYTPSSTGTKRIELIDFPAGMMYTAPTVTVLAPGEEILPFRPEKFSAAAASPLVTSDASSRYFVKGGKVYYDVPRVSWFTRFVAFLLQADIASGYETNDPTTGQFGPHDPVTRSQIAKMALRSFYDTPPQTVALADYAALGSQANITLFDSGLTQTELNEPGTRGETVLALLEAARIPIGATPSTFPDVPTTSPFSSAIETARALGIVEGYGDGTFRPDAPVTRAEFAKILMVTVQEAQ